jgi:iron complex transport system substrate-binding protein
MLAHYAQRIVSLQPSASVILSEIGAADRLVACTKYCEEILPGIGQGRVLVADSWTAERDQILAAKPDLVIAAVPYQQEAVAEILKVGVRFLGLAPHTLGDIYMDIATIAGVVGRAEDGIRVIGSMQQTIDRVRQFAYADGAPRPRVFCEEWGKPLIASQLWVAELVEAAGGEFVGKPGEPITPECIREMDPDYVVAAWCGAGDRVPLEKIVRERGWEQTRAALARQVYCVPDPWFNTPAPTLLRGLNALFAILHPPRDAEIPEIRRIEQGRARTSI